MDKETKEILLEMIELIWEVIDNDENDLQVNALKWWDFKNKIKELEESKCAS